MTIRFCHVCWAENPFLTEVCQACGSPLHDPDSTFVQKLILALRHPEPLTAARSAWLLGKLRAHEAVEPLVEVLATSSDPGVLRAVAEALGEIGDTHAVEPLVRAMQGTFLEVRIAIVESLAKLATPAAYLALQQVARVDPSRRVREMAESSLQGFPKPSGRAGDQAAGESA